MPHRLLFLLLAALTLVAGCDVFGSDEDDTREVPEFPTAVPAEEYTVTQSGLKYYDIEVGEGDVAVAGEHLATVHYTGWLADSTRFESSLPRGEPFTFAVGAGQVIEGWDEGVAGMREGGTRQLVIPPELAYGAEGRGSIPPNATLIFEVELLDVR